MKGSNTNGKNLAVVGLLLLVAMLVVWVITDTLFSIGLIVGAGMAIGGLILMMMGRKATT